MTNHHLAKEKFGELLQVMDELREQCPWDKKQTIDSLRSLTIEECYELTDAIIKQDFTGIAEELGDLQLHILFYARIASEQAYFSMTEVLEQIIAKLKRRHPHIYGDLKVETEEEVRKNWEAIKLSEKKEHKGLLSGVPHSLPAVVKAFRMQQKAAQVGFEWTNKEQVWDKVMEEMNELQQATTQSQEAIEEELGDLLFALINYARFLQVDPELALEKTNRKFKTRFEFIENHATKSLSEMSLEEMEELWQKAKKTEARKN